MRKVSSGGAIESGDHNEMFDAIQALQTSQNAAKNSIIEDSFPLYVPELKPFSIVNFINKKGDMKISINAGAVIFPDDSGKSKRVEVEAVEDIKAEDGMIGILIDIENQSVSKIDTEKELEKKDGLFVGLVKIDSKAIHPESDLIQLIDNDIVLVGAGGGGYSKKTPFYVVWSAPEAEGASPRFKILINGGFVAALGNGIDPPFTDTLAFLPAGMYGTKSFSVSPLGYEGEYAMMQADIAYNGKITIKFYGTNYEEVISEVDSDGRPASSRIVLASYKQGQIVRSSLFLSPLYIGSGAHVFFTPFS